MKTFEIFTTNYDGYIGDISYSAYTGGTISLGSQLLPYDYNTDYYYGTYAVYIPFYNKTCILDYPPPSWDLIGDTLIPFISSWKTDNDGNTGPNQIGIALDPSGTFNFVIDWGDGNTDTITSYSQPELTHTYNVIGTYTIRMFGVIDGFNMQ